mgnify:CR=1 FL=1
MEIVGKVIQILPLQQGTSQRTGNPWALQSFVIETQEQYPRKVCIELFGEERIKANPFAIDEIVTVSFDLESREFNGRWYTSVRAWKVQKGTVDIQSPVQTNTVSSDNNTPSTQTFEQAASASVEDDGTDLPF